MDRRQQVPTENRGLLVLQPSSYSVRHVDYKRELAHEFKP